MNTANHSHLAETSPRHPLQRTVLGLALLALAPLASATDGYFTHGYGMKAQGRGGASIAYVDDAFGGANNPAAMAYADDQIDLGLTLFSPRRSATRSGLGPGLDGSSTSGSNWFPIPEFAYRRTINDVLAWGITVYGNGGMNTDYPGGGFNCGQGPANMLCGMDSLGVNLEQLMIAPTLSWEMGPGQALGISPLFAYQRFEAKGLHAFAGIPGLSQAPDRLTNNGTDTSTGVGVRIGYLGQFNDAFSFGLTYASKVGMSRFSDYSGLFAEGGKFDLPENYGVGFNWKATDRLGLGLDYVRIIYSGIASIAHPSLVPAQLGADNGPGFGWQDVDVWKLGVEWASSDAWTWRAGFNHTDNPVRAQDVTFNILAPGVVINHLTLGFTHALGTGELSVAYMHAFEHSRAGASILPAFMGGAPMGVEQITMYEDSIGVQYRWNR